MGKAAILVLLISLGAQAEENTAGTLRLYRWNPGAKPENVYALETTLSETDYRSLFASPAAFALAHKREIFSGCYLSAFAVGGRAPASAGNVRPTFKKICFPY